MTAAAAAAQTELSSYLQERLDGKKSMQLKNNNADLSWLCSQAQV